MYNHEPDNYICPFCLIVKGVENDKVYTKQADIVHKDEDVTAFIASHGWKNNPGHVIIIANRHFENIYDLPNELSHKIADVTKQLALVMKKAYTCDGISTRQHNEPDGGQDVWHYHLHLFPRYKNDRLNQLIYERIASPAEERVRYAEKLRTTQL